MPTPNYKQQTDHQIAAGPPGSTLLLHSCCGPCSTAVLERLGEHFAVTAFFYNPNILPEEEYERRLEAQKTVIERLTTCYPITLRTAPYDPAQFRAIAAGMERAPEGGTRCARCFRFRLEETARLAKAENFDFFTTTLSVSPRKDARVLNEIGTAVSAAHGVPYLIADFKKDGGHPRSVELAKAFGIYRQNYCGCTP